MKIICEVLTVVKTTLPQTDTATIQGHTNKGTDRLGYLNDSEIQDVLGVNTIF
jgi:hypothetical protein